MKRAFIAAAALCLMLSGAAWADTEDTAQFRVRMLPDNEVPPVSAAGASANGTLTLRVLRDARGLISAATVMFEVDYTMPTATTSFTGLHVHNAPAGSNGSVVIDSGITSASPMNVTTATGRIQRIANYTAADTTAIRAISGLLDQPQLYYLNLHTTTNPSGIVRGQLRRNSVSFRPYMHPSFENPPIADLDAEGAAHVVATVNRDAAGAITSGTVTFIVDYRFPAAATITGLHIHNGAEGANGPVVLDTGINGTATAISATGRGTIFRMVDVDGTNATQMAALNGLMTQPENYYVNLHTSVNPSGAIRGQLSSNLYAFFNRMTGSEEVPPVNTSGFANSVLFFRADRDTTGNISSGAASFNLNYNIGSPNITFTGLHVHNGNFGANGGVVINTGISGANPVVSATGAGSLNYEVNIDSTTPAALDALRGLLANSEAYYVNLHTTTNAGGIIRAQLGRETYRYRVRMSPANEVPPIQSTATGMGWISVIVHRDTAGAVTGGSTIFDVNYNLAGPAQITGLHIHDGSAGINGPVRINTGIGGAAPVDSTSGIGNVTRVADTAATDANGIAMITQLISNPESAYANLHTVVNGGGIIRGQLLPVVNYVPVVAGGGDWITSTTVRNASSTEAVSGQFVAFQTNGSLMPEDIADPIQSFRIPAGGSQTFNLHNRGAFSPGYARVHTDGAVTIDSGFVYNGLTYGGRSMAVTSRGATIPVNSPVTAGQDTGVAVLALNAGTLLLTLRDSNGNAVANGSRSITVTAGQQVIGFVRELLTGLPQSTVTGTLTVEMQVTGGTGRLAALALQFGTGVTPITVTAIP